VSQKKITIKIVPAMIQPLKGSSSSKKPNDTVDIGPIMRVCAVKTVPMRSIAIMTQRTGKTVHATQLALPAK
jgi:hypothetical protein